MVFIWYLKDSRKLLDEHRGKVKTDFLGEEMAPERGVRIVEYRLHDSRWRFCGRSRH